MTLELPALPDKDFFTMGEISKIAQVPAHTLRYWEARVGLLKPARRSSGHRRYTREDLELVVALKDMILRRKLTLAGARRALLERKRAAASPPGPEGSKGEAPLSSAALKLLREVRQELRALVRELK